MPGDSRSIVLGGGIVGVAPFVVGQFTYVSQLQPQQAKGAPAFTYNAASGSAVAIGPGAADNDAANTIPLRSYGGIVAASTLAANDVQIGSAANANLGGSALATQVGIAIGNNASTRANGIAIGRNATTGGVGTGLAIGDSATMAGTSGGVILGAGASVSGNGAASAVVVGNNATATPGAAGAVVIGNGATATGGISVVIGSGNATAGTQGIAIGDATNAATQSIAIGAGATSAAFQAVIGGNGTPINMLLVGQGLTVGATAPLTFRSTDSTGVANLAGGTITFRGNMGTGTAVGADIIFQTANLQASGATVQTPVEALRIRGSDQIVFFAVRPRLTEFAATGAIGLTLTNGPATATAGPPQKYFRVQDSTGVNYVVPAWTA